MLRTPRAWLAPLLITALLQFGRGYAELPAGIYYLSADFKYNAEQGLKICELQGGLGCMHRPAKQLEGSWRAYARRFCDAIEEHQTCVWYDRGRIPDKAFLREFELRGWWPVDGDQELEDDENFAERARAPCEEPERLAAYHGAIAFHIQRARSLPSSSAAFPGILLINEAMQEVIGSKWRTRKLFASHPALTQLRPTWQFYSKQADSEELIEQIKQDFPQTLLVIKPAASKKGRGVIIVDKNGLPRTLKKILGDRRKLRKSRNPDLRYWASDKSKHFLIEEFVESDSIRIKRRGSKAYDPTGRISFVVFSQAGQLELKTIAAFWQLPLYHLGAKRSLTLRHKSRWGGKRYAPLDRAVLEAIETQLSDVLPMLLASET